MLELPEVLAPVFDSLLSIKTAVDQYLWGLQRFCLLF